MQPNKWLLLAFRSLIRALTRRIELSSLIIMSPVLLLLLSVPAYSAVFNISSGDVPGLIAAINAANLDGGENTINLVPGTYRLTAVDNDAEFGPLGLPSVSSTLSIIGSGAEITIIERDERAPDFRIMFITESGKVLIDGVTVRGGGGRVAGGGAGIRNDGDLILKRSIVEGNNIVEAPGAGGGIANRGTLAVTQSVITRNSALAGGGIGNFNTALVRHSTIGANEASVSAGGGVFNLGDFTINNSTISKNAAEGGAGILSGGTLTITNSTVSGNVVSLGEPDAGAIFGTGIRLQNTIVAGNFLLDSEETGFDCRGDIISLGNNIIGDPTDCGISLLASDRTGDPGLGAFVDSGAPGTGRFPLLEGSQAIDAGNNDLCASDPALATDQLDTPRRGACDIGAIEFYPVVNDLVALANLSTDFDPTPVSGGPAGTFRVSAEFINTSNQAIGHRFMEVVELGGGNLLLNADGGAGGVGARVTSSNSASNPLLPGATETFEFVIGLENQESFTFLVNMLGDPQTSNANVSMR